MNAIWERIQAEPAAAISIVGAFMSLLVLFGVPLSDEQQGGVTFFLILLVGFLTRQVVTPVAKAEAAVKDAKQEGRAEAIVTRAMSPTLTDDQLQAELDRIELAVQTRKKGQV